MHMQDVLASLVQQLPEAVNLIEQMVSMESPSLDKDLTNRFVNFVASKFKEIGGEVEFVPAEKVGNHLRVKFSPSVSANRILLLGHTDTVWPAGEIVKRPFRIESGRATGPGVFDMKAGILLMWMVLQSSKNPVTVLLTSDEEAGSNSSRALIESEAGASRAVLVVEPSRPGGVLKTARKGVGRFTVKAIGRAAHAGIDPEKGVNAVEEISRQILKLQSLTDAARGTTVT